MVILFLKIGEFFKMSDERILISKKDLEGWMKEFLSNMDYDLHKDIEGDGTPEWPDEYPTYAEEGFRFLKNRANARELGWVIN